MTTQEIVEALRQLASKIEGEIILQDEKEVELEDTF